MLLSEGSWKKSASSFVSCFEVSSVVSSGVSVEVSAEVSDEVSAAVVEVASWIVESDDVVKEEEVVFDSFAQEVKPMARLKHRMADVIFVNLVLLIQG